MKKLLIPSLLLLALILSACGNDETENSKNTPDTITYQSENGPVEVPADPQRVIVFHPYAGYVMALDVGLVGVDTWAKQNPRFQDKLEGVEEVTEESLEKIIELNPDLIIGLSTMKNTDKLNEIAPTVTFTHGKLDYLSQYLEIGKLLNKEKEAQAWIDDFKIRAQEAGDEIRERIGEDATVTIIENFEKQLYVYGDSFGRGGEILYQEMKLKMPKKVKDKALDQGYYALSLEVLPEYVGDYLIISNNTDTDTSFLESDTYKNIPAVKNNQVFKANSKEFFFNDPITLEYQLEFFKQKFLKN
jgi:iron complex transport system substrate-binding protein